MARLIPGFKASSCPEPPPRTECFVGESLRIAFALWLRQLPALALNFTRHIDAEVKPMTPSPDVELRPEHNTV